MVDRTGGYYGLALRYYRGVDQGYQFSSTIFNVVMNAVVRNWVSLVVEAVSEPGGRGGGVLHGATYLYAEDGLVTPTDPN